MSENSQVNDNNRDKQTLFAGFASPTSNTTFVPNQFFDVCLRHYSRGVVRLVGYMIRKTLGWCDAEGNPQNATVRFSYAELEKKAGLGHSMIRLALDQASNGGFIHCIQRGKASSRTQSGRSAVYELAWDESSQYIKDTKRFSGFFAGEGNRTYIPNQYFDQLIPFETLATIKVVGTIIRFSIGFVNKYGHRRQHAALSYADIQRYSGIANPTILSKTIVHAIVRNYIQRVEEGYFDPEGGRLSRSACYALKWSDSALQSPTTPKSVAEKNHSEKRSGGTPKRIAAKHSEKDSDIQIKQGNKTFKQQVVVAETLERLKGEGFGERAAEAIASRYPAERIHRQIDWIDRRKIKANRLGMLRAAIDQEWAEPPSVVDPTKNRKLRQRNFEEAGTGVSFAQAIDSMRRKLS